MARTAHALLAALVATAMLTLSVPAAAQSSKSEPTLSFCQRARSPGKPRMPGLKVEYLAALGDPAHANKWAYILVHQTEGPPGSAKYGARAQARHPTRRGVTLWVEVDGTVYWAVPETAIPTQGDGANRNDNRYVDNSKTYRRVLKHNSLGVEFSGNYPDVAKPPTAQQRRAWLILVRFLQERYRIPSQDIYAHNWIDYKDHRYCEGCTLATAARKLAFVPSGPDCSGPTSSK